MNVLVTGGLGYLGCAVTTELLARGHKVTVLDNCLYGNPRGNTPLITADVTDPVSLTKAVEGQDAVIHLAAIVGEGACNLEKEYTVRVNYLATRSLAEICQKRRIKLIFLSTASVYGAARNGLLYEDSEVFPTTVYAITKLAAEDAIKMRSTDHIIFRLGTLFGPSRRMRFDLVVNRFVAMAALKENIVVFGGSQFRPFLHVADAADAFSRALEVDASGLYNLGGNNYRILDVAELIAKRMGAEVSTFEELSDPRDYRVSSDLAKKTFSVSLERTIETSIDEIAAISRGKNYKAKIYNNEEWLRQKWLSPDQSQRTAIA